MAKSLPCTIMGLFVVVVCGTRAPESMITEGPNLGHQMLQVEVGDHQNEGVDRVAHCLMTMQVLCSHLAPLHKDTYGKQIVIDRWKEVLDQCKRYTFGSAWPQVTSIIAVDLQNWSSEGDLADRAALTEFAQSMGVPNYVEFVNYVNADIKGCLQVDNFY